MGAEAPTRLGNHRPVVGRRIGFDFAGREVHLAVAIIHIAAEIHCAEIANVGIAAQQHLVANESTTLGGDEAEAVIVLVGIRV